MKKKTGLMLALVMAFALSFTMAASCGGGGGTDSPKGGTPAAPSLSVSAGDKQVTLSWTAPSDIGDSDITKYEVQRDKSGGGSWIDAGTATTYTFTGLENGTTYTFKVRAVNTQGAGAVAEKTGKPKDGGTGDTFEYGQDYINSHLGENYAITYTMTTYEDGDSYGWTMEQRRTAGGYYVSFTDQYDEDDKTEWLFVKETTNYSWYQRSDQTLGFAVTGVPLSETEVKQLMAAYLDYMWTYSTWDDSLVKGASETLLGRSCDKYSFDYPGGILKYTYWIEKTTGVCLKFTMDVQSGGQKAGYEFLCTEFKTSGVTLPDHTSVPVGDTTLVGKWTEEDDSGYYVKHLEFKSDGTYVLKYTYEEDGETIEDEDVEEGTYQVSGSTLTLTDADDNVDVGTFEIVAGKLLYTNSVGEEIVYIK